MNKVEKFVYDKVKSNPVLKTSIRNMYQSIYDFLPDKEDVLVGKLIEKPGYFFGFHDVSPFSKNEKYILSNKLAIPLRMPVAGETLTVGYWDSNLQKYTPIKQTQAWNYHKGCRLQWVGETDEYFIFNDVVNDRVGANICSIGGLVVRSLDYPIDTVSPDGKYATSFSYERLNRYMPGYGYIYTDEPFFEEDAPSATGLFLVNIESNTRTLIVPLSVISSIQVEESMKGAHHYVTHTQFSPDGTRVAFLHRWTYEEPSKRFTRLVTCKLDGSDIHISNTSGMVSHYDWDDEHGILAYCQVNGVDGHYIFKDYRMEHGIRVGAQLNSDGHQSYIPKSDFFVTDTYPDKRRRAKLYLVNIKTDEVELIADLKSPKKFQSPTIYKHWACDLHPRVSPSGKWVSFDTVHTGERAFGVMEL